MKILVDADACPVKDIIEEVAIQYDIPVYMFVDTSHILHSDYSQVIIVSRAPDAVDFALLNHTQQGDVVVTRLWCSCHGFRKESYAIHHNGKEYLEEIMDKMLKNIAKKARMSGV